MAYEGNRYILGHVEVEEPLQDIVTDEFSCAIFECKISDCSEQCTSCRWYKDGKCIESSRKFKITSNGKWHRLQITTTTALDQGVYVVLLKNYLGEVFSKANLYVKQIKENHVNNDVLYLSPMAKRFDVVQHLRFTKVLVGDTIELEAVFNCDALEDYIWYKSNNLLVPNKRMIILNDKRTTTLSILCAKESDTGIYHVVSKSEYGVASSFASVVVINTGLNTLNTSEVVPSIDETLPDELEVNEGEDVRLICKASYDVNTLISWSKNGARIEENKNVVTEYYNNRYISLRIRNTCLNDTGEYSIAMRDKITGQTDSSGCFLTINEIPKEKLCSVQVKKPLEPTVTCFGTRISFTCSFAVDDPRFYFVVWYVGHFRVERTNHRFHMMHSGGEFYLVIKQVEPGMANEVICELRKALPNRKSILSISTATTLTIVPAAIIESEIKLNKNITRRNIFYNINVKLEIPIKHKHLDKNGIHKCLVSSNGAKETTFTCESLMIITLCRLDDDIYYLNISNNADDTHVERMTVYEKSVHGLSPKVLSKLIVIEWFDTQTDKSKNGWYHIDMGHTSGSFVQAGVSSLPMFEIKDPPVEQIMKFRIRAATPLPNSDESRVCILPAEKELRTLKKNCNLRPMEDFEAKFTKTGDIIGCGAFGSVVLVHDNNGEFYAAKILKTRTQKKRDTALREYEMMRRLQHPKLVELYDTFTARESFILVMDYLWGGELFDRIVEEEHIKEVDVVPYVRQICEALRYLHERKIAHLDLKPENIICLSPNSRQVKIIDFGLARVLDESHITRAIYGTRDYVAPEVLNFEQLTLACDMWSLGVVTYMLLSGVMPFSGDSWPERSANITMANYNYHESAFKEISDLAKDFVDHLLVLQPEKRMKASVALNHQWIVEGPPGGARAGHMKRAQENLKSYLANHRARWQRAGNVMIAAHRLRSYVGGQRNVISADRESPRVT
ncbi:uncharacterized protein LOC126780714 [Nymphalis io]|uniref:uncharacterized protein LOC126780714 n=1 Tax=Inachis io TaxID=171585 RepID=UPI002169250D|nr:uncharacterized protein LOC126780714 [Nymphalis io]XP_050361324.1 uncharacterized protein LOC126780714 [Nymphalis io]